MRLKAMKKIWNNDYRVRLMDLPCTIKAFVAMDEDGFNNIYVNSKLSREEQRKAVMHELNHLARNDFYNDLDIRTVEA